MKFYNRYRLNWPGQVFLILLVMLMPVMALKAQVTTRPLIKNSFKARDVFKSAVFLENKDIVEPYKGEKILYYTNHDHVKAYFTEKGVIYKIQRIDKKKDGGAKKEKEEEAKL